jgi:hypothetical protein
MNNDPNNPEEPPEPSPSGSRLPPKGPGLTARGTGDPYPAGGDFLLFKPQFPHLMPFGLLLRLLFKDPRAAVRIIAFYPKSLYLYLVCLYNYRKEIQRRVAIQELRHRRLYFKLPLRQTDFHWNFKNRQAILTGKLTLSITGQGRTEKITVFEKGKIIKGWDEISSKRPPEDIYFGFSSSRKYQVCISDDVMISLWLPTDVEGIGPFNKGILKAGDYETKSRFTIYETHGMAFFGDKKCDPLWDLVITDNKGWMADKSKQA